MTITIELRSVARVVVFLFIAGTFFAFLWPVYQRALENANPGSCQSNLKQVSLGMLQYVQDYDERYPPTNLHDANITAERPLGWADALQPYLKSTRIFRCPEKKDDKETRAPNESGYTDYWFNRNLSGVNSTKINHKESIFFFGDGNDGTDATNARYSLSTLPRAWRTNKTSPAHRHLEGANHAFADAHVKWLAPKNVSEKPPDGKNATFRVQ